MSQKADKIYGAALVGFGPAGLAVVQSAQRAGRLSELLGNGLLVLHQDSTVGSGSLGKYAINSDSTGATFLDSLLQTNDPASNVVLNSSVGQRIGAAGPNAIPLRDAGELLRLIAQSMQKKIEDSPQSRICLRSRVECAQQTKDGGWRLYTREPNGQTQTYSANRLILATGGSQLKDRLEVERVAHVPVMARWGQRVIQSDEALSSVGLERLNLLLRQKPNPRVAILGGSTSAMSVAHALLNRLQDVKFGANGVTLFHRRPFRVYYTSKQDAWADSYTDFDDNDLCPLTGRVYRLAGLRLDSRELLMGLLGVGGRPAEPRIRLHQLKDQDHEAVRLIDEADVVVVAFGYRPNALPLFASDGKRIVSFAETGPSAALVDGVCRVIDVNRVPVHGVFAIGLAAGFVPHGRLGGEPSFTGQANGLWLWQTAVGSLVVGQVLQPFSGTTDAKKQDKISLRRDMHLEERAIGCVRT